MMRSHWLTILIISLSSRIPAPSRINANYASQLLLDSLADLGVKVKVDIAKAQRP